MNDHKTRLDLLSAEHFYASLFPRARASVHFAFNFKTVRSKVRLEPFDLRMAFVGLSNSRPEGGRKSMQIQNL